MRKKSSGHVEHISVLTQFSGVFGACLIADECTLGAHSIPRHPAINRHQPLSPFKLDSNLQIVGLTNSGKPLGALKLDHP
jgi:hypothetical protein